MDKRTEKILKEITNNSIRKDILESELFKLLRYRKMLDPDRNSSIVIGRIPKAFKDEGYKVLGCNFDDVLDTWITVIDMSDKFPEEWRPVKGYESLYDVSNWGRIMSLDHWKNNGTGGYIQKGRMLKPVKTKKGYLQVHLCKDGKKKCFRVHRLVWEAFNGIIPDGYEINHINENKTNNRLDNLNLLTHKANVNYGTAIERMKEKLTNGKLSDPVLQLTLDDKLIKEWPSTQECGRNGFNQGAVAACCRGERKTYKGFKWVKKINYIK